MLLDFSLDLDLFSLDLDRDLDFFPLLDSSLDLDLFALDSSLDLSLDLGLSLLFSVLSSGSRLRLLALLGEGVSSSHLVAEATRLKKRNRITIAGEP